MKKSLFLAALVLMSTVCFAQKNPATKKAKNYMNAETPDFNAARTSIREALETEPTAETYFWAGMIGYKEVNAQNVSLMMGQGFDYAKAGEAAIESYEYWLKADELAQVPVLNKKGVEVPTDPKMRGKISKMMLEYYKGDEFTKVGVLVKYGSYLNDQRDFARAYKAFRLHVDIPDLPMMQDPKLQKEMVRDTTYYQYKSYAAQFAIRAELHEEAIELLEQLKDGETDAVLLNQYLYSEYAAMKDTAKVIATLQHAIIRFPKEEFFVQNYVSYAVQAGSEEKAIEFFTKQIEGAPNDPLYYNKRGLMYEMLDRYEEATLDYDKALEFDPNSVDAYAGKGRVLYNRAVKLNEDAAMIADNKEYKKALDEMNAVFRQSLPFFEKAHELDPSRETIMQILKGLYYRFIEEPGMEEKYNEMAEKLNNL